MVLTIVILFVMLFCVAFGLSQVMRGNIIVGGACITYACILAPIAVTAFQVYIRGRPK